VDSSSPTPTVQWQISTDSGKIFTDITGDPTSNTQTLMLTGLTTNQNGTKYRAVFTNELGSVTTDVVKLAVVPLVLVSPAHASPSTIPSRTTVLSALGDATAGEAGLTYSWSIIHSPAGAASPTFNANDSNAARQVVATFHKDGRYLFRCTITDANGNTLKTDVQVEVAQTATSLRLSPHDRTVAIGHAITFHAALYDQFGHPIRDQSAVQYSIFSGAGTIDPNSGIFSSSLPGADLIEADEGTFSATVGVQVVL
jgi:hypothetical protein